MKMKILLSDVRFLGYTLFHPFNGFYELRFRRERNWFLIAFIFAVCGIVKIAGTHYSGFIVSEGHSQYGVSNWYLFLTAVFPYLLFAVANWSVTTLFDGNGSLGDVLMVLSYAMIPRLITDIVYIVASNFIISEELILLNALYIIGIVFFCFLTFSGLCVVHEYSPSKNIVTIIATAAAAVVIIFIGMLYLEIMGKVIGFITTITAEIMKRG